MQNNHLLIDQIVHRTSALRGTTVLVTEKTHEREVPMVNSQSILCNFSTFSELSNPNNFILKE